METKHAKLVASIRRRKHGGKVGGADDLRRATASVQEAETSPEEIHEGSLGDRGKRQRWKRWHGCRRAQEADALGFLCGSDNSHRSDAQTAAKRSRHQNFMRRRVRHLPRVKPAKCIGGGKGTNADNDAVHQKGRGHSLRPPFIWAWAGVVQGLITEGTKPGEALAPLSDHMEELNKLSIEEKCGVIKHCRIDKTFRPLQCRVSLAVETQHLRHAVEKPLKTLHCERKQGQGPRTALARELQDWLEVMK